MFSQSVRISIHLSSREHRAGRARGGRRCRSAVLWDALQVRQEPRVRKRVLDNLDELVEPGDE
jgi:hypothetical protein